MRRPVATIVIIAAAATLAAAGFWAGRVALAPPDDPLAAASGPVTYEVVEQTIGQSLQFAAVAEWDTNPLGRAWAAGIVTSVEVESGDSVQVGDVLFSVDLRPIVVALGQVPAFRDLQAGDAGEDVAQLQAMLATLGFLNDEPDGEFGDSTQTAVRAWQDSIGVEPDGVVRHGDIIFTPQLPVRIKVTEALDEGAPLVGGEVVVNGLSRFPAVVIPLTVDQRNLVPLTGKVRLVYPDGTWEAVIARAVETNEQGVERLDLVLEAPGGGPVCGDSCAEWIPPEGRTNFPAEIVVIPETSGPVVPVAAIATNPGGRQSVELADGSIVDIEVLVSTGGLAVVRGIAVGDVVVLPFTEPPGG